jgi:hypothetical protein
MCNAILDRNENVRAVDFPFYGNLLIAVMAEQDVTMRH